MIKLPRFPKLKLRIKFILLFLVVSSIPLAIAMSLAVVNLQKIQKENTVNTDLQIARAAAEEVKAFLLLQYGVLESMAATSQVASLDKVGLEELVDAVLHQNDNLVDIAIVDSSGREIVKKDILQVVTQADLIDRANSPEFIFIKRDGYYIGPVEIINGKPLFLIGEAIRGVEGSFKGAIFAQVDARVMQDVVKRIASVGLSGHAYIVDSSGVVIAHPDLSEVLSQKNYSDLPVVRLTLSEGAGVRFSEPYLNKLKREVIGAGFPVRISFAYGSQGEFSTNWYVIAEQPVAIALAAVNQVTVFSLIILASVLIISFLISIIFARSLVKPIEQVHAASRQVAEGNLGYRVSVNTQDEIEDLAKSFNEMAENLQRNITQLTYQNKLLQALRNLDKAALSTLEMDLLSQTIVDLVSQELGYMFGVIALVTADGKGLKRVSISKTQNEKLTQILNFIPIPFHEQIVPLSDEENLLVKVVKTGKSLTTNNFKDIQVGIFPEPISEQIQRTLEIKKIYIYPLVTKNRIIGVIYYGSTSLKEELSHLEYLIMEEFSHEAARSLENALLYQDVKRDREVMSGERNKLAITLSAITDGVIAVDSVRRIIIFNKAAEEITGYKLDEVLGKKIDEIIKIVDGKMEVSSWVYCPVRLDSYEGIVYSKDGLKILGAGNKERYVNVVAGQIKEGRNINLGCILTIHDVTKERELEQMKLDFVSMAAHELRTPLTSLKGYIYIFLRNYRQVINQEQLTYLIRMNIATQKLVGLVENLLNVSRIERGVLTINLEPLDWYENVKEVVSELLDQVKDKKQELVLVQPSKVLAKVSVDKFRINEVLTNLLSNAINYTPAGGKIKVWLEQINDEVITHIEDNGPGIPEDAIPHLFTKFFRVSGKLEQGSKGTGLGLYIAKSIVIMHKGRIWVESQVGHGSVFSFALPIASSLDKDISSQK